MKMFREEHLDAIFRLLVTFGLFRGQQLRRQNKQV